MNYDRFYLLYSLLHLAGYDLPLEQLKLFRQRGTLTLSRATEI